MAARNTLQNVTTLVVVGVGLFLVSKLTAFGKKTTEDAAAAIAKLWVALTSSPAIQVLGDVEFPTGATVPLRSLTVKTDAAGAVYTMFQGHVYRLQPHNARGNWPAVLVK